MDQTYTKSALPIKETHDQKAQDVKALWKEAEEAIYNLAYEKAFSLFEDNISKVADNKEKKLWKIRKEWTRKLNTAEVEAEQLGKTCTRPREQPFKGGKSASI